MWRRVKRTREQPVLRPNPQAAGSTGRDQIGAPFPLGTDLYDLADHPTMAGWQVMHDPRTATVTLYRPNSGYIELGLANAVRGRWMTLKDEYGKTLPIELYRDQRSGSLFARWIEVFGADAPDPGPEVPEEVRRQAAQDASEQSAQAHARAMGIIYNIRA